MNKNYSPYDFFMHVPSDLLRRYFDTHKVLAGVEFSNGDSKTIDALYHAWLELDDVTRVKLEAQFQEIHDLSTEKGVRALVDAAEFEEDLLKTFETENLLSFEARVFWAFLERNQYWAGALSFNHADSLLTFWKKRSELGNPIVKTDKNTIGEFEKTLVTYFQGKHGMGKHCKVVHLKRVSEGRQLEYFFAYPEDHARSSAEYDNTSTMSNHTRRKAFEVIFLYCPTEDALDVWCTRGAVMAKELMKIFASVVLGVELKNQKKDKVEFELTPFKSSDVALIFEPQSGVESIYVNKLRLTVMGSKDRIVLESDPSQDPQAVYKLFEKIKTSVSGHLMNVTQVGFTATFAPPQTGKQQTRKFSVSYPDSCSLKHTGNDAILRQVLIDSGIQPKPIVAVASTKKTTKKVSHDK